MASSARLGFGTLLKVGDGGVGAGVKAFVEWGTTNAKIRIRWKVAGTAGNGKNITVAVSGASYVLTTLDSSAISITVPTTATVAQVIAYLYTNANFNLYWEADYGATPGDGSSTITARTVTPTASGTNGTEVFTSIAEVKSIGGFNLSLATPEVTHMESVDGVREYLAGLKDAGDLTVGVNFLPTSATHTGLMADLKAGTIRNLKLVLPNNWGTYDFTGFCSNFGLAIDMESAIQANLTFKLNSYPVLS